MKPCLLICYSLILFFVLSCTKEPEADFTINFQGPDHPPSPVFFYNTSANADSYKWDFGDGNYSTETSPKHTFYRSGTFDVKLTSYNHSKSSECLKTVTILEKMYSFVIQNRSLFIVQNLKVICFDNRGSEVLYIGTLNPGEESDRLYTKYTKIIGQWNFQNGPTITSYEYGLTSDNRRTFYID